MDQAIDMTLYPPDKYVDLCMTNYDFHIDEGMTEALKAGYWGWHCSMDFCCNVRWDGTQFVSQVNKFRRTVDYMQADTLEQLMIITNKKHATEKIGESLSNKDVLSQLLSLFEFIEKNQDP